MQVGSLPAALADPEVNGAFLTVLPGGARAGEEAEEAGTTGRAGATPLDRLTPPLTTVGGGWRSSSWNTLMPARSLGGAVRREEAGRARGPDLRAS